MFDLEFSEGEFIAKEVVRTTMMVIQLSKVIPEFTLDREGLLEKLYMLTGFRDINIKGHLDFSKRFFLFGEEEERIKAFFTDDLVRFFESNPYYHVESNGSSLLIFHKQRIAGLKEIKALIDFGSRLHKVVENVSS